MPRFHVAFVSVILLLVQLDLAFAQRRKNEAVLETVESIHLFDETRAIVDMAVPYGSRVALTYELPTLTEKGNPSKNKKTITIWVRGTKRHRYVRLPELPAGQETKVTVNVWWQPKHATCEEARKKACKTVFVMNGERHFVHIGRLEFEKKKVTDGQPNGGGETSSESTTRWLFEYFTFGRSQE